MRSRLKNDPEPSGRIPVGSYRIVFLLFLISVLNYVDRLSIAVLQVPIKDELGLTDSEMGAITGLAFASVYTIATIPIAAMADRHSHRIALALSVAVWSAMTFLSGLSRSFETLVLCRTGVALGEAGGNPCCLAILSKRLPATERARAIAAWQLAFPIGVMIGIGGSGLALQMLGWRNVFFVLGGTGLLLVPIILYSLRGDRSAEVAPAPAGEKPAILSSLRRLWAVPALRHNVLGGAFFAYTYQAVLNWAPPLYTRAFGMEVKQAAHSIALVIGGGGLAGIVLGGMFANWLVRRDARWHFGYPAVVAVLFVPALIVQCFAPGATLSLAAGFVAITLFNSMLPAWTASGQSLAPPRERATVAALQTFAAGIIGGAGGPFLTGVISDLVADHAGLKMDSLRWAIALSALAALTAAFIFLRGLNDERAANADTNAARAGRTSFGT